MSDSSEEKQIPQELIKLNIIKKLKEYKEHDKIAALIKEFKKKQESDYFLTQSNIKIGKITPDIKKENRSPYLNIGRSSILSTHSSKMKQTFRQNSLMRYKYSNSLSSSK